MVAWHLALGALDELQLSIAREPDGRLALHFDSSSEWPELPYFRLAMAQHGRQIELHPLHAPAQSLPLPRPMAPLDDLWLLVRTATRRYWFEVPYGVCGSPARPGGPAQEGPPRTPPGAMLDDVVIPWRAIRFSLGRAGECDLELICASVRPGELELEARRDTPGPPPEVEVAVGGGALQLVEPWRASAGEPALTHVARYAFVPAPEGRAERAYVQLQLRGAVSCELALPTSLTEPAHHSAARHRTARV